MSIPVGVYCAQLFLSSAFTGTEMGTPINVNGQWEDTVCGPKEKKRAKTDSTEKEKWRYFYNVSPKSNQNLTNLDNNEVKIVFPPQSFAETDLKCTQTEAKSGVN